MSDHECDARSCDEHPHCFQCGGVMTDEGSEAVCDGCGVVTPIVNRTQVPAEATT